METGATERRVWYQLVDASTREPFPDLLQCSVSCKPDSLIQDLADSILKEEKLTDLTASRLKIYETRAAYDQEAQPLIMGRTIGQLGDAYENPVIVQVPLPREEAPLKKQKLHPFLESLDRLKVAKREYDLDKLVQRAPCDPCVSPVVPTPTLHSFWKGFGGFPPSYLPRKEEAVFWQVIKSLLPDMMENRIVLVGSPGVGKSCFLMLLAFYLACVKEERVVVIRKLKLGGVDSAVVYLDGHGHFARRANVDVEELRAIRRSEVLKGANFLLDGFTQAEVNDRPELRPFNILATSCQFDCKGDDSAKLVVLPAWQMDDLLTYATWTSWVMDAGLRTTLFAVPTREKTEIDPTMVAASPNSSEKPKIHPILAQLAMEQFFFSGGSLREFCRQRDELKNRTWEVCDSIDHDKAIKLVYTFRGGRSNDQVDRVARHYVKDSSNADHYKVPKFWTVAVDSGYALRLLGQHATMELHGQLYKYARSIGGGFEGIAYEQLFHRAVAQAVTNATADAVTSAVISTPTVTSTPVVTSATADAVTSAVISTPTVTSTPVVTSATADAVSNDPAVTSTPVVTNVTADAVTCAPAVTSTAAVGNAVVKACRVQLMALPPSEYTRLEICASKLKYSGENETECNTDLQGLDAETYWHPEFLSFPFIDAVAPCDAYRGDGKRERVLALIQVTIRNEKEFNRKHWKT